MVNDAAFLTPAAPADFSCCVVCLTQVRHRQRGAAPERRGEPDWLAGRASGADTPGVHQPHGGGAVDQVQVHHGAVLHVQQPDQRRLRQRVAKHQLREGLLHLRHAHRL